MKCPFCEIDRDKVVDSRPSEDGESIRRRRECIDCGKRFTTYEKIEHANIMVVKKDGTRELFDRSKIIDGVVRASMKRPISAEQIESTVSRVEEKARNNLAGEISSKDIGEWVTQELKELDDVAYVRFASVYRQFKDVSEFMDELKTLLQNHEQE